MDGLAVCSLDVHVRVAVRPTMQAGNFVGRFAPTRTWTRAGGPVQATYRSRLHNRPTIAPILWRNLLSYPLPTTLYSVALFQLTN